MGTDAAAWVAPPNFRFTAALPAVGQSRRGRGTDGDQRHDDERILAQTGPGRTKPAAWIARWRRLGRRQPARRRPRAARPCLQHSGPRAGQPSRRPAPARPVRAQPPSVATATTAMTSPVAPVAAGTWPAQATPAWPRRTPPAISERADPPVTVANTTAPRAQARDVSWMATDMVVATILACVARSEPTEDFVRSALRRLHRYTVIDIPWCSHAAEHQERRGGAPGRRGGAAHRRIQDRSHSPRARRTPPTSEECLAACPAARVLRFLEDKVWTGLPPKERGRRLSREEEDAILGLRARRRMTLDSSALLAILFSEAGHLELIDRILEADHVRVGVADAGRDGAGAVGTPRRGCQRRRPWTRWSRSWA